MHVHSFHPSYLLHTICDIRIKVQSQPSVCLFWIRNCICPTESTSKGEPTESCPTTHATSLPRALSLLMFPAPPPPVLLSCILHQVRSPSPPLSCTRDQSFPYLCLLSGDQFVRHLFLIDFH